MKKVITKIVSIALALSIILGICSACDWIVVNTDRDMAQIIATVKISDKVNAENIKKKDLNAGFMSYGYQYVESYGYSISDAYGVVLENLVSNRIIIQQSRIVLAETYNGLLSKSSSLTDFESYFQANALADGSPIDPKSGDEANLKKYLTAYEYAQVLYETRKNINDLIKAYEEDEEEEEEAEILAVTDRTAPVAKEKDDLTENELKTTAPEKLDLDIARLTLGDEAVSYTNIYDLNMAVFNAYTVDVTSSTTKKKAFSELLNFLKTNGLIASAETQDYIVNVDNILKYSYFTEMSKSLMENFIVKKYEKSLETGIEAKLTNEGVWDEYEKKYKYQEALYKNDFKSYESALENVTDSNFVLYNPYSGYGYVMNLLIPFSTEQSAALTKQQGELDITEADLINFRQNLASKIFASDQRETWVYSSHGDYIKDSKTFKFSEGYRSSELTQLSNFIGKIIVKDADGKTEKDVNGVDQTSWIFKNAVATEISMTNLFADYITPATGISEIYFEKGNAQTVNKLNNYSSDIFDNFNDLMYTFSTDTGCLGRHLGYVYSPFTSDTTYVKEFADATKEVVALGVGGYTTVLTDFGYHIILCTGVVETTYDLSDAGKAKFMSDLATKDTLAYKYRKSVLDTMVNTEIDKVANKLINEYIKDETKVVYFKKTYSDLITD